MFLLRFLSCALALATVSARKASVRSRKGNSLQQVFDTITIDLEGFSEICANDFLLQSAPQFQNAYLSLVNEFADQCVVRNDVDFRSPTPGSPLVVLNTDPCEQIVDSAESFGDISCTAVNSQLCSLVIDETVDLLDVSDFFLRSVYTYYICVPTACPSADVADAVDQALLDLQASLQAGTFFEDPQIDVLSNTFYEAVLFCDADGVPARFGQGFNLTLEITGQSDVVDPQGAFITIESPPLFSVDTTVSPAGLGFTAEIYGTNAAAELNADFNFQNAGCIAYWRTESTVMDSRLQLFCPTDAQINALVRDSQFVPQSPPVPIQEFEGLGFSFGGAAQMDEFDEPEPTVPPLVLTSPVVPGITAPIPTLGLDNGASTMGPKTLVAAASFVAAALAM